MRPLLAVDIKNSYFNSNPDAAIAGATPGSLVSILIPNAIIIAGLIFLGIILFSGFKLVIGAGHQQSAQDAAKAKAALTWGVVGFLIVVMGYFILQIIGAMLGINLTILSGFML